MNILFERIPQKDGFNVDVPNYANPGDAGADLQATESFVLQPGERRLVSTGIKIAIENGYVGLIHPRSGLAAKSGITVVNAPGTIDAGYRGEIKVCLLNTDQNEAKEFNQGDRIAQIVFQKVETAEFIEVEELPEAKRGEGGFGSSGR
jgi:dUTP pyrophosphatase